MPFEVEFEFDTFTFPCEKGSGLRQTAAESFLHVAGEFEKEPEFLRSCSTIAYFERR